MDSLEFKTRTVVVPCRLEYQLIHGEMLLYIVLGVVGTRLSLGRLLAVYCMLD